MPQIESIELPISFDSYTTEPVSFLKPISRINIFVGSNNSGKSRFLRMLSCQEEYKILLGDIELNKINLEIKDILTELKTELSNTGLFNLNELSIEYFDRLKDLLPKSLSFNTDSYQEFRSSFLHFKNVKVENGFNRNSKIRATREVGWYLSMLQDKSDSLLQILNQIPIHSKESIPRRAYIPVLRGLRPIDEAHADLYATRTIKDYFTDINSPPEVFTGLSLYKKLMEMLLGNNAQRKVIGDYQRFISETLFESKPVTLIPCLEAKVVIVKIGNEKEQPIFNLGDGIQSAIIMTFLPYVIKEPTFFFIEEPEIYLHPGLQRKILNFFADQKQHLFFLTTHSNHFLDLTIDIKDVSIFTFRKQLSQEVDTDEQTPTFIEEAVESGNSSSLELLGVRNSSVFLVNATIWVEGITDRWYLRAMLNSYMKHLKENDSISLVLEEDVHYSFVEYGGNNITHWSFLDNETRPIEITRLCAKALVVVDKDGDTKQARREKLEELLGERLIILPAREIENLLPYKVIKGVILEYEKKPDLVLPDKKYSTYQNKYLGTFIEEQMFKNKTISRKGGYKAESGTIKSKTDFCEKALPKIYYQDLPDTTKEVILKIYEFIRSQNF